MEPARVIIPEPAADTGRQHDLFLLATDGSGAERRILENAADESLVGWSPGRSARKWNASRIARS